LYKPHASAERPGCAGLRAFDVSFPAGAAQFSEAGGAAQPEQMMSIK
jgi:hypothetical protein